MQSAESLWGEFIVFCGMSEPDDWLAVDFVIQRGRCGQGHANAWHSQRDLRILQALLTWRAKNSPRAADYPVAPRKA